MRFKFHKAAVLGAVAAMSLAGASAASASTVTVSPSGTAVTGTATTHAFLHAGSSTLDCATSSSTLTPSSSTGAFSPGIPVAGPVAPASPLDNTTGNGTISFGSCSVAGIPLTVNCSASLLNLAVTGATSGGVTPGRVTGVSCTITLSGCGTAVVAGNTSTKGGVNASYKNPASPTLTVSPSGQNLKVTSSTCGLVPVGPATFTGPSSGPLVYAVSGSTTVTAV